MKPALSLHELLALPATVDLLTAARAFGLGRTRAYELAARGGFPCRVLRIGGTYRVPTADLHTALGLTPNPATDASPPPPEAGRSTDHTSSADRSTRPGARRETPETRDPGNHPRSPACPP